MDIQRDRYVDLLREDSWGLILSSSPVSVTLQVPSKQLTCGLTELVEFRSKSRFEVATPAVFAGNDEKLARLEDRLTKMLEQGLTNIPADDAIQVLSGSVPDALKWLLARPGRISPKKAGSLILRMMDVAVEWLKCVPRLQTLGLGRCDELPFEDLDLTVEFKRYRAIRYTPVSLVNRMRARFLEAAGFDSLAGVLDSSPAVTLQYRLPYLPVLQLHRMIAADNSESLYGHSYASAKKTEWMDYRAVHNSFILEALKTAYAERFLDYPSANYWKTVCRYAEVLLNDREADTISVSLKVFQHVIDSEGIHTAAGDSLQSAQDAVLKQYLHHQYREAVSDLFATLIRRHMVAATVVQTVAKGTTYLRLLHEMLAKSLEARDFEFLKVLAEQHFAVSKLGSGTENRPLSEVQTVRPIGTL